MAFSTETKASTTRRERETRHRTGRLPTQMGPRGGPRSRAATNKRRAKVHESRCGHDVGVTVDEERLAYGV
jgi:hypothetical protein